MKIALKFAGSRSLTQFAAVAVLAWVNGSAQAFTVGVPQSDLVMEHRTSEAPSALESPRLHFTSSSWTPSSLSLESRVPDTSAWRGSGIPHLSVGWVSSPIGYWGNISVAWVASASFVRLKRDGSVSVYGASQSEEQFLYVFPFKAGVEGKSELFRGVSFVAGMSLMPTLAVSSHSVFDDGRTVFGIPLELSAGVLGDLQWVSTELQHLELELGVLTTMSRFTSANFSGSGIQAGLRFPM